jgi:hypothetical protein
MDITPQDSVEKKAVGLGAKIGIATGILTTALCTAFAALGGYEWITKHLDLLLYGVGLIGSGAVAVFVAIRRMRLSRGGYVTVPMLSVLCLSCCLLASVFSLLSIISIL